MNVGLKGFLGIQTSSELQSSGLVEFYICQKTWPEKFLLFHKIFTHGSIYHRICVGMAHSSFSQPTYQNLTSFLNI